ncbi:hypothetical protein O1611_g2962 [Lasiodiplodia mahajangana]|uniref:Uncharacterized protein n=1 Tax=Lasiodiplodia mahajangana TaxID=1108764 RepID=A0ACC2JTS6_9PEZI|nr:hypothetical protein O1611_g2962 [Lasiodiplodia mahajangana]
MDRLDVLLEEVASVLGTETCSRARLQEGKLHQVYKISTEAGKSYSLRIPKPETAALTAKRGTALLTALKDGQPRQLVPLVIYESDHFSILHKTLLAGFGEFLFHVWTAALWVAHIVLGWSRKWTRDSGARLVTLAGPPDPLPPPPYHDPTHSARPWQYDDGFKTWRLKCVERSGR